MVHTRTIQEAAAYFQENDPQTCLTETAIRRLLRTGTVPSARVGRKYLVTIETLEAYLGGSIGQQKRRSISILPKRFSFLTEPVSISVLERRKNWMKRF